MQQLILFTVGTQRFAMDLRRVSKILNNNQEIEMMSESGGQPSKTNGRPPIQNCDLSGVFGEIQPAEKGPDSKILLVECAGVTHTFKVDRIDKVTECRSDQLYPLPAVFSDRARGSFSRVFKTEGEMVPVLEPQYLIGLLPEMNQ